MAENTDVLFPSLFGSLAQGGQGIVEGYLQAQMLGPQLEQQRLETELMKWKMEQAKRQMMQPQLHQFNPGSAYGFTDPRTGQLTGPIQTVPNPLGERRLDIAEMRGDIARQRAEDLGTFGRERSEFQRQQQEERERAGRAREEDLKARLEEQRRWHDMLNQWKLTVEQNKQARNQQGRMPPAALKMQQDSLDAIGTVGTINDQLMKFSDQIATGKLPLGPMSNIMAQGRNLAGISTPESRNFSSFKATLEKLRNDSLRLNKGVQTEGDAVRAWNELVSNINDPQVVQQRLQEIADLNQRAAGLHQMQIDVLRQNYNAEPLDAAGFMAPQGGRVMPTPQRGTPQQKRTQDQRNLNALQEKRQGWGIRKID